MVPLRQQLQVQVGFHPALRDGGAAHGAQDGPGLHRVPHGHGDLLRQIGVYRRHAVRLLDGHRGAHHGVGADLSYLPFAGGQHLESRLGGDVHAAVGAPVPHGGVIGQGLGGEGPQDLSLHRPGVDHFLVLRLGGDLLLGGLLHRLGVVLLDGRGGGLLLRRFFLQRLGGRGLLGAAVREGDGGVGRNRLAGLAAPGDGADEIIARNSNGGDAQEQDYVEALSQHEIA